MASSLRVALCGCVLRFLELRFDVVMICLTFVACQLFVRLFVSIERGDIAIRLIEERSKIGYSQADFARKLGVSRETLRRYEIGESGMSVDFLAQTATLGIDVQYVLLGIRSANAREAERAVAAPGVSFGGGNNGNVIGFVHPGATVKQINTHRHIEKTIAEVKPGDEHISDEQAAALHALVDTVVETENRLKQKPRGHRSVWGALNAHCNVPQYRLIRADDFAKAQKYLHQWVGRLDSMASAPVKDGDSWRKRKYAYIKINSKVDPEAINRYIAKNFGAVSLTDLDNQQLEQVYRSTPCSSSAPKSLETAPPSKSARTVKPALLGKRSWCGVESFMGGLV